MPRSPGSDLARWAKMFDNLLSPELSLFVPDQTHSPTLVSTPSPFESISWLVARQGDPAVDGMSRGMGEMPS